ncbi:alpha/beta hydrolase [Paracoccus tegillarcae]|uniref:Phospholipase n=1 Tax=Paracoccus tegillarcae TaxID=1529068 RepID=A0A2K9EJD8_9RHOB|nr:alpha/beta fold hydrolase [Paracoccus tegillarcae]AUH34499.1 phospholipase [Paracoccus tegillarcae]
MVRELKSQRRGPEKADAVVVFLHGYGADGADLLGLADPLSPHLPGTAFYAPNAPEPCVNNPAGYQWFPIPWLDGSTEAQAKASMGQSIDDLNAFFDKVLGDEGLTADRMVVFGFSQGTMMALHVLPRRDQAVAGIVACSGRLLEPELLEAELQVKPPVLLMHGDQDEMVPFDDMGVAGEVLVAADFEVYAHVMKGTGHGIAPDGLSAALGFITQVLGK